jgi:hypothetical protein
VAAAGPSASAVTIAVAGLTAATAILMRRPAGTVLIRR